MSRLAGRVAVVTGGARGIGLGISTRLLQEGAQVVVAGRDDGEIAAARRRLDAPEGRAALFAGDLSHADAARDLVAAALDTFGRVDVLVNNAGGGVIARRCSRPRTRCAPRSTTTCGPPLRVTLAVLPHMVERGYGRIVSVGAESVRNGLTDHAVYNAAKGGVHGFSAGLAREFAGAGITANVVAPSYTRTPELDAAFVTGQVLSVNGGSSMG